MSKYTATAASSNIVDEMMQALRPHVSPAVIKETDVAARITTPAGTQVITRAEARSASALDTLQQMQDQLASLRRRLESAMDHVAIAAGAERCPECDSWTLRSIPFEDAVYCLRCLPPGADCPF